jgi:tetratricopeptide (TPR) repeat protein
MEKQVFVARERELGQLDSFLNRALAGQGQVCFVIGEAGSGKTALITEFARRVQEQHDDLIVAVGQSDAQTGVGDAYLPFREMLSQLTGDVDSELARGAITQENANRLRGLLRLSGQALVDVGPDLVGIFVPGAGLAMRMGGFVAEKVGWLEKLERLTERQREGVGPAESGIEQSHIFEQYTNVLKALAVKQPLMLVLDDLQWADGGSIDLLFRLGRRIGESRILIVGTYRPDEVALGRVGERHPLEKVLAEFERYFGDVSVDLGEAQEAEGENFVDAFVDTEPNKLGEGFRQALYHHTGGHPLFTIELLRVMQERGDLVRDKQGQWVEGPVLDWEVLPARVEGVIKERIGRLEEELRQALCVGSVEGENFTAEVVAGVQSTDARGLIRQLSGELEKQHRLVSARGLRRLDGQRLSLYRFQHNLFQTYLYRELDDVERGVLHEDVGNVLERLYGENVDEIAVQLAYHFVEADIAEKARTYLSQAGEQAAARFANDEALTYFSRALELTPEDHLTGRYDLLLAREVVYDRQGEREAQAQDLTALERLAEAIDEDQRRTEVALRRAHYAETTGAYPVAIAAAQDAISLAQTLHDVSSQAVGHIEWGAALHKQGEYEPAQRQFETALALAQDVSRRTVEARSLLSLGNACTMQDDYKASKVHYEQALHIYREIGDRLSESRALNNLGLIASLQGNYPETEVYYEQALHIFRQVGLRQAEGVVLQNFGVLYAEQADYPRARSYFEQARTVSQEVGDRWSEGRVLCNLGCAAAEQSDLDAAHTYFEQALLITREIGNQAGESDVLANLGNLKAEHGDYNGAKVCYEQALHIVRRIDDPRSVGHVLRDLGNAAVAQGDYDEARDYCRRSLETRRSIGDRKGEADSLSSVGELSDRVGDYITAREYLEQALQLSHEIGDLRGEGCELTSLGLLSHHLGDDEAALEYSQQGLEITRELRDRIGQGRALTIQGHALLGLDHVEEAANAYREALTLRHELGQLHLAMEPLAGIARVCKTQNDSTKAQTHVEEIMDFLIDNTLDGPEEPFRIYLTCYRVLHANGDPRAQEILNTAHNLLQEQSVRISDEKLRRSFLENVRAHREILSELR